MVAMPRPGPSAAIQSAFSIDGAILAVTPIPPLIPDLCDHYFTARTCSYLSLLRMRIAVFSFFSHTSTSSNFCLSIDRPP